jgi:glutathione S-transferase
MSLEYVDLATARAAKGTRMLTSAIVASPWSEAAKGLFTIAGLPALVVARPRGADAAEHTAWAGVDNVPVVIHDGEPPRTNWAAIVGLVARLSQRDDIVPSDVRARAALFGLIDLVAGEGGLGWNARLAMIHASLTSDGARGFALPVATYLAGRYGYSSSVDETRLRERARDQLALLRDELRGRPLFGGETPSVLDAYVAAFLTPLTVIDDTVCPQMIAPLRHAFSAARELLGELVPAELWAVRTRMFERHLALPIRLS